MHRYVAFLRGMNLGGRRIENEELWRHFEGMRFEEVATFRASGNVVFSAPKRVARSKGKLQVSLLKEKLGAAARRKALALASDEDLLGPDTRRTMGTIEQIAARHC